MATATHWHDIDDCLAADFDGSLSGLGMELGTSSFNMRTILFSWSSDTLMALPSLSTLKQEAIRENGDTSQSSDSRPQSNNDDLVNRAHPLSTVTSVIPSSSLHHGKKNRLPLTNDDDITGAIKRFCVSNDRELGTASPHSVSGYYGRAPGPPPLTNSLSCAMPDTHSHDPTSRCRHSSSAPDLITAVQQSSPTSTAGPSASPSMLSQMLQFSSSSSSSQIPTSSAPLAIKESYQYFGNSNFQYVLAAATSIATKIHEETMTYLNQGQSYEIKLKKLGDLTEMRGKMLKSIVRVGFQERRLQYMEKEQITQWQLQRIGERIVEIDVPLSYGVYDVVNDPKTVNMSEFLWDPTKETGVFVRVNCISTEFTPKKHGGEKGVPFRIQIETYSHSDGPKKQLHVASCQVKVFKPKGADRKHKTDREKMSKRAQSEQEKYQPSYDCTVFSECPIDSVYLLTSTAATTSALTIAPTTPTPSVSSGSPKTTPIKSNFDVVNKVSDSSKKSVALVSSVTTIAPSSSAASLTTDSHNTSITSVSAQPLSCGTCPSPPPSDISTSPKSDISVQSSILQVRPLSSDASSSEAAQWLLKHRFDPFIRTFSNFSGADILSLNRDDLIQICGLADGIRLYNSLHSKGIRPRLTLFVCLNSDKTFHAIYLENLKLLDFASKLCSVFAFTSTPATLKIFYIGPLGIRVLVTDEVVQNMKDDSMFTIEKLKDQSEDGCKILLKTYSPH